MEKVRQIDHACHVTSLTSEHTFLSHLWDDGKEMKVTCLFFFYVLSTRTIYFTTFSNVSYKSWLDPTHRWKFYNEQIRIQISDQSCDDIFDQR